MKLSFVVVFLFFIVNFFSQSNLEENSIVINDTSFVDLKEFSNAFVYDMKYATTDNFLKEKVYDCDKCYLRFKTIKALIKANTIFLQKGYRIKIFDCYRPVDIQKKMWNIVPNDKYVANPNKGSIHNRGNAVDITLVDNEGNELDMGTSFDYFGKKSSHQYKWLSKKVKNNRKLLKDVMQSCGFAIYQSEWWHYNYSDGLSDKVSNFKWNCD